MNKFNILLLLIVAQSIAGVQETPTFSDTLKITFTQINDSTYAQISMMNNVKQETWFDAVGLCEYLAQEQAVADEYLARTEEEYKLAKKESDRVKKWIKDIEKDFKLKCKKEEVQ